MAINPAYAFSPESAFLDQMENVIVMGRGRCRYRMKLAKNAVAIAQAAAGEFSDDEGMR